MGYRNAQLELETAEEESNRLIAREQMKLKKRGEAQDKMAKSRALNEETQAGNAQSARAKEDRK
jgi:hypothetical protein